MDSINLTIKKIYAGLERKELKDQNNVKGYLHQIIIFGRIVAFHV